MVQVLIIRITVSHVPGFVTHNVTQKIQDILRNTKALPEPVKPYSPRAGPNTLDMCGDGLCTPRESKDRQCYQDCVYLSGCYISGSHRTRARYRTVGVYSAPVHNVSHRNTSLSYEQVSQAPGQARTESGHPHGDSYNVQYISQVGTFELHPCPRALSVFFVLGNKLLPPYASQEDVQVQARRSHHFKYTLSTKRLSR